MVRNLSWNREAGTTDWTAQSVDGATYLIDGSNPTDVILMVFWGEGPNVGDAGLGTYADWEEAAAAAQVVEAQVAGLMEQMEELAAAVAAEAHEAMEYEMEAIELAELEERAGQ